MFANMPAFPMHHHEQAAIAEPHRDSDLAADVTHGHASRDLLQDRRDLFDGKALSLHGRSSWPPGRIVPGTSPSAWADPPGAPHSKKVS